MIKETWNLTSLCGNCFGSVLLNSYFDFECDHFLLIDGDNDFQFLIKCKLYSLFDLWYLEQKYFWTTWNFLGQLIQKVFYKINYFLSQFFTVCFSSDSFLPTDWSCYFCGQNVRCTVPVLYSVQCTSPNMQYNRPWNAESREIFALYSTSHIIDKP